MNQVFAIVSAFGASMVNQMLFHKTCTHHRKFICLKRNLSKKNTFSSPFFPNMMFDYDFSMILQPTSYDFRMIEAMTTIKPILNCLVKFT